jgi:hypothetical protein
MTTLARIASVLLAASAFAFPLSAMAEVRPPEGHHHFPMKAEAYRRLIDGRIQTLKGHFEQGLEKRSLSPEQKAEIEKSMDGAVKELHAAVRKAGADGMVTGKEAERIKDLSEHIRSRMRAELKGKHANAKAKGAKSGKSKLSKVKPALSKTKPALSKTKPALSKTKPALSKTKPALSKTKPALSKTKRASDDE